MNREAAKIVLAACRPNGVDANDPLVAEALAFVQRDAELRAWFAAELPAFMRPARIVLRDQMPLGPNGKLDRAALRAELDEEISR